MSLTKGSIFVATGNVLDQLTPMAPPTDGQTLVADSGQSYGWKGTTMPAINTDRDWSTRSSPEFNTVYTPSATQDTNINAIVNLTSTLITAATVEAHIDTGPGYVKRAKASISGLAATSTQTLSFKVPAGGSYKVLNTSGTATIDSLNELLD